MLNEPIIVKPEWQEWLVQSAQQDLRTASDLVNEALEYYYHARQHEKLNQEVLAYEQLHSELWRTMLGEWAAIHQQALVDHDSDRVSLYRRIRAKYPHTAVLICQARAEPVEEIWWRPFRPANHI
jgi:hypothetical protein